MLVSRLKRQPDQQWHASIFRSDSSLTISRYLLQPFLSCPANILLPLSGIVRFAEPLALTSVFPYLPEMIRSFGIPQDNVAKWAGLVGSMFSISQSLFAVPWGRLSDKIGRKPTILIGLVNVMFCFLLWGTSKSLTQALTARFLMGLGNGNGE